MFSVQPRDDIAEGILQLTIDRPDRRNAVDRATLLAMRDALVGPATEAKVVVLTGAPPAFCAGADLGDVDESEFTALLGEVLVGVGALSAPVIAAVDGPALGAGTQLAIACDLRVATASSRFGIPAARLGLMVDRWTVERLGAEFGWSVARNMLLTATTYDAGFLAATGAVHRVGDLSTALGWAAEIAALAPLSIAGHKLAIEAVATSGERSDADALIEVARRRAWASDDAREGRQAFMEKRPAHFGGS